MRTQQRAHYAKRIEQAIALLERKVAAGAPPTLDELSAAAALSSYHFHRIFRLMTGERVGDAITRVRLAHAVAGLSAGEDLHKAADRSGYASTQAFAKALKARTGASPSALRGDSNHRAQVVAALSKPAHPIATGTIAMPIEVVCTQPLQLIAMRNVGDYRELNQGFGRLFEWVMERVSPEAIVGIYGVPHDDPRETDATACRFDCALLLSEPVRAEDEFSHLQYEGGAQLRLSRQGDYDHLHEAIDALYTHAIAQDMPIKNTPLLIHYLDDPEQVPPEQQRAEVYLALEVDDTTT